jgi:hypothetical protein
VPAINNDTRAPRNANAIISAQMFATMNCQSRRCLLSRRSHKLPSEVVNFLHRLPRRANYTDCLHDRDDFHQTVSGEHDSVSEAHSSQVRGIQFLTQRVRYSVWAQRDHFFNECHP